MHGGFMIDENNTRNDGGHQKFKERGGLLPITAKILHDSVVNSDEGIEYNGNLLSDVCIVGYLKSFVETDTKVNVKIWDHTGVVDTIFYNKNENEIHGGLSNFSHVNDPNKLVKIWGTVKTYKKDKNLQGAKIEYVNENELIHHTLEVINDWLHLTGKIDKLKEKSEYNYNQEAKNLANTHSNNTYNSSSYGSYNNNGHNNNSYNDNNNQNIPNSNLDNQSQIMIKTFRDTVKGSGKMKRADFQILMERKNFTQKSVTDRITILVDSGFMFEDDDYLVLI